MGIMLVLWLKMVEGHVDFDETNKQKSFFYLWFETGLEKLILTRGRLWKFNLKRNPLLMNNLKPSKVETKAKFFWRTFSA